MCSPSPIFDGITVSVVVEHYAFLICFDVSPCLMQFIQVFLFLSISYHFNLVLLFTWTIQIQCSFICLFFFSFDCLCQWAKLLKTFLRFISQRVQSMLSSMYFVDSGLILMPLIHFQLIFVNCMRYATDELIKVYIKILCSYEKRNNAVCKHGWN